MKKLLAMVFVLGLAFSSVSFAQEDQSGGECKNKAESSVSKEEVIGLKASADSTGTEEEAADQ